MLRAVNRVLPRTVTARIAERLQDTTTQHTMPWSWVDAGGLYHGHDGAWLYVSLPLTVISSAERNNGRDLAAFLHDLASRLGDREIHLVSHAWEEPATVPSGLPESLTDHLEATLRMFVPARGLLLGVKLHPDTAVQAKRSKLWRVVLDNVDQALGEQVPDYDEYDRDRDAVLAVLAEWGAVPAAGVDADHLESWYNLGTSGDVEAVERDDVIYVASSTLIETVAIRSFPEDGVPDPRPLISAGANGCAVVSVRGSLATKTDHRAGVLEDPTGTLSAASIVIGRRSTDAPETLAEACAAMPGIEVKPLPLRQVMALDETLPCSTRRMNPNVYRVGGPELARAGLAEPTPAGDPTGLFVGLAAPDFAYPCYLNPGADFGQVAVAAGDSGAGKTFLAEHLAIQALAAGLPVTYLSGDGESGRPLVEAYGLTPISNAGRGALDPFRYLEPTVAAGVLRSLFRYAVPDLSERETEALHAGLRRAVSVGAGSVSAALSLMDNQHVAARLVRFTGRHPLGRLICGTDDSPVVAWTRSAVSVPHLLGELTGDDVEVAQDVLTACALAAGGTGAFVVADGVDGPLRRDVTAAVAGAHVRSQTVSQLLCLTSDPSLLATSALAQHATTRVALATVNPDGADLVLRYAGVEPTTARRSWLADASVELEDRTVLQPARGLIHDRWGRTTSLITGPVPRDLMPVLTRDLADRYLVDADI